MNIDGKIKEINKKLSWKRHCTGTMYCLLYEL